MQQIPVANPRAAYEELKDEIDAAIREVLDAGQYILGRRVEQFEVAFARFTGAAAVVAVASGTDAITLSLLALGVGPADEVVTVGNTAVFTALAISATGARPVFCDVDPAHRNMDPGALERSITARTRAIVPVHLYGNPAPMDAIMAIADERGLAVVEDAAQAAGAVYRGRMVGTWGTCGCFSFYPTKNLGAIGDAGAITTADPALAERLRMLRNGGQVDRYHHVLKGTNSRMDEIQAAVLTVKLPHLERWNRRRRKIASRYNDAFLDLPLGTPEDVFGGSHVYHLYVVTVSDREGLRRHLSNEGIGTQVHYPVPVHLQQAYLNDGSAVPGLPVVEELCSLVVSLPLYPEMTDADVERVIASVTGGLRWANPSRLSRRGGSL